MSSRVSTAQYVVPKREFESILHVLDRRASEDGSAPAMHFFHDQPAPIGEGAVDSWGWAELRTRARSVAAELIATEARRGARVLLVYPAGLAFVAAFYGCLYAGMVPVPVPPPHRSEGLGRWRHVARDAGISGVLTFGDLVTAMRPLLDTVTSGGFCLSPADADPARPFSGAGNDLETPHPEPGDLAFLQYTSGSTSEPKGVMISHGNLMANLRQISLSYQLTPADRMASWLPHFHDMGLLGTILAPLHDGFKVALMAPGSFLRRPLRWLELASHFRATIILGPNFGYDHCARRASSASLAGLDLGTLRIAAVSAETIRQRTLSLFDSAFAPAGFRWDAFFCCYGMAEATVLVSTNQPAEPPYLLSVKRNALTAAGRAAEPQTGAAPDDPSRIVLAGCGRPVDGLEIAVVDPAAFCRRGDGEVGEIWIKGPNVSAGYWQRPEQNAEIFGLSLDGRSGWFRTGDLGFLHEGQLYVTGRLKDVIIIRGENHYPQDIEETAAASHPALTAAGAFAVEIGGAERLGIVCELSRAAMRNLEADAVLEALRGAISQHHDIQLSVAALIRPGSLPRTPSGKVQRFACRKGLAESTLPVVARWDARLGDDSPMPEGKATLLDELHSAPRARREDMLRRRLQEELARLAGLQAGQLPPADTGFFDLGLDSVAVAEFGAMLQRELGLRPEPTLMFEHPNLSALSAHLAATLLADAAEAETVAAVPPGAMSDGPGKNGSLAPVLEAEMAALRQLLEADPPTGRSYADGHGASYLDGRNSR